MDEPSSPTGLVSMRPIKLRLPNRQQPAVTPPTATPAPVCKAPVRQPLPPPPPPAKCPERADFKDIHVLGSGSFGDVVLAINTQTGLKVVYPTSKNFTNKSLNCNRARSPGSCGWGLTPLGGWVQVALKALAKKRLNTKKRFEHAMVGAFARF